MTTVGIEEFRAHVDRYLAAAAAQEPVVVTQDGKPWVVLQAADSDGESLALAHSTPFWQMIQQRRQEQGIPWDEAKKQLDLDEGLLPR